MNVIKNWIQKSRQHDKELLADQACREIMEKIRSRDFHEVEGDCGKMRVDIPVLDRLAHDVMSKRMTPETFAEITNLAIAKVNVIMDDQERFIHSREA